jgi:hypothetical protein
MKTVQEVPSAFDRMSTYEELHQVLDLLSESVPPASTDTSSSADTSNAARVATIDLWSNPADKTPSEEHPSPYEMDRWADVIASQNDRAN